MAKISLTDVTAGHLSSTTYSANNTLIEDAIENTLSRDGTSPNSMSADLDMNSQRITNLPTAVNNSEPITLGQSASIAGVTNPITRTTVVAVTYPTGAAVTGTVGITAFGVVKLDISSAVTATLGSGTNIMDQVLVTVSAGSTSSTLSVTNHVTSDPEVFTFTAVDDSVVLMWIGTEWITIAISGAST